MTKFVYFFLKTNVTRLRPTLVKTSHWLKSDSPLVCPTKANVGMGSVPRCLDETSQSEKLLPGVTTTQIALLRSRKSQNAHSPIPESSFTSFLSERGAIARGYHDTNSPSIKRMKKPIPYPRESSFIRRFFLYQY